MTDEMVEKVVDAVGEAFEQWFNDTSREHGDELDLRPAVSAALQSCNYAGLVDYEELAIIKGQQVVVTFKDSRKAFDLFNEIKSRAALQPSDTGATE